MSLQIKQKLINFKNWCKKQLKWIILLIIGSSIFVYVAGSEPSVFLPTDNGQEYGVYFDDIKLKNGNRAQTISSSPRNVYEDDGWKRVEDARSLKSVYSVNYLREDKDFSLRIEDFNYSSVKVCLRTTQLNQDIPFKVFTLSRTENGTEKVLEEIEIEGVKSKEPTIRFMSLISPELEQGLISPELEQKQRLEGKKLPALKIYSEKKCFVLDNIYILNKHLEFGFNSSEIYFDGATEFGHIVYFEEQHTREEGIIFGGEVNTIRRGYIEWNIKELTEGDVTLTENPVFIYEGAGVDATDEEINPITEGQPSVIGDEELYDYIATGNAYVNPFDLEEGEEREVDLGISAKSDLQNAIDTHQEWFAIGFQSPVEEEGEEEILSMIGIDAPPPTLYVRYAPEPEGTIKYYFDSYNEEQRWEGDPENMVDGSTFTFAIGNSGGVQENDRNTCSGVDLGTITKVELRFHGYASEIVGEETVIKLSPYFKGSEIGDEHSEILTTSPFWSTYFDITADSNAPEWGWKDVGNLWVVVFAGEDEAIYYCSKVEIRVTYTEEEPPVAPPARRRGQVISWLEAW